jgi:hypothetical protein
VGFHAIPDDVHGIGLRDRPTHAFIGFDQRREDIEAVGFGRARWPSTPRRNRFPNGSVSASSDSLHVDAIVFGMRADEFHQDALVSIGHMHDQPILIACLFPFWEQGPGHSRHMKKIDVAAIEAARLDGVDPGEA